MKMKPLISPAELKKIIGHNPVILDARGGPGAFDRYTAQHITGAQHVDLDRDLSSKKADAADGGRHPLPDIKVFSALLGKLGIRPSDHVIIYDDKSGGNAAARCWWMLRAVGHSQVQVLDGGLQAAEREGIELTDHVPAPSPAPDYPVTAWQLPTADIHKVADAVKSEENIVIDVREAYRYEGESEPIDLVAGHIPGAVNIPYPGNLDEDGKFLPANELAEKYRSVIGDRPMENVIVHCGSGVTACHTLLALEQAGLKGASLYVGSWSEWSRNDRPVA